MKHLLAMTISIFITLPAQVHAQPEDFFTPSLSAEPSCVAGDASCVVLQENQSFDLADWGALDFLGIPEDSRCPLDAFCIWQGRVRVLMKHQNLTMSEKFEVGLGGDLKPQWIDESTGLKLSLEQVWPEKLLSAPSDKPYQIKLRIEAVPTDSPAEQNGNDSSQQNDESDADNATVQ